MLILTVSHPLFYVLIVIMLVGSQLVHVAKDSGGPRSPRGNPSQLLKWGGAAKAGFQLVPNVLFRFQKHLEIDSVDVVILLNLSLHWWGPSSLPFPSPALIAKRMGVSRRTIERRMQALERRGFIKRLPARVLEEGRPKARRIEMSGLVEKLEEAALRGLAQRQFVKRRRLGGF